MLSPSVSSRRKSHLQRFVFGFLPVTALLHSISFFSYTPQVQDLLSGFTCLLGGCSANAISLEFLARGNPDLGFLCNFLQLCFVSGWNYVMHREQLIEKRVIPLRTHALQVLLSFAVTACTAISLQFGVPAVFLTIVRSGTLLASLSLGVLFFGRKFNLTVLLCVLSMTAGIILSTWKRPPRRPDPGSLAVDLQAQAHSDYISGILVLVLSLFLSTLLGQLQERMFELHGRHLWRESLFYLHLFSIPIHVLLFGRVTLSALVQMGPSQWLAAVMNALTQYLCIRGVYMILSASSSLTLNVALTLRKLASILLSVWLFSHSFLFRQWCGTLIVIFGSFFYCLGSFSEILGLWNDVSFRFAAWLDRVSAGRLGRGPLLFRLRRLGSLCWKRHRVLSLAAMLFLGFPLLVSLSYRIVYTAHVLDDFVSLSFDQPRHLLTSYGRLREDAIGGEPLSSPAASTVSATPSAPAVPTLPDRWAVASRWAAGKKFVIAANLFQSEDILPNLVHVWWQLIGFLGRENVFVSIYENGSQDDTPTILDAFEADLTSFGIAHRIVTESQRRPLLVDRIVYLADKRNRVMEPLVRSHPNYTLTSSFFERHVGTHEQEFHVIFFNDIYIKFEDVLELLATNGGHYDMACAMDFYGEFYDRWVTRDRSGRALDSMYPYFLDVDSQHLVRSHKAVPVYSCWNGIVVFPADVIQRSAVTFRSRHSPPAIVSAKRANDSFCFASECLLFCKDLRELSPEEGRRDRIFMNPNVRVAYSRSYYYYVRYVLALLVDPLADALRLVPVLDGSQPESGLPVEPQCIVPRLSFGGRLWAYFFAGSEQERARLVLDPDKSCPQTGHRHNGYGCYPVDEPAGTKPPSPPGTPPPLTSSSAPSTG